MKKIILLLLIILPPLTAFSTEYYVSVSGKDSNRGTKDSPFRTIGKAAEKAYPGDIITVHEGTYREWINPPRGGRSNQERIVYRAAEGETVKIKGSEVLNNWVKEKGKKGVWKCIVPNSLWGENNSFTILVDGDWFSAHGRTHHTADIFLNEKSLFEVSSIEEVIHPVPFSATKEQQRSLYTWYCENDGDNIVIWANFHEYNPNKELVEAGIRNTCFYPDSPGVNYITITGFDFSQAATQWGAPTAEQIGMIATNWNKGWIIENNVISNSRCSGITLGKEKESGHNLWLKDPKIDGSIHYLEVIFNTLRNGWNKDNIGSHIVRNNVIHDCEQTAICGSMGAAFSLIEDNHIYDIWVKRQFSGAEIAGIKFHGAIDTQIRRNRIHNSTRALWLDWMTQGTRVSRNLFYDNDHEDIWIEVSHGPFIIDNNILASNIGIYDQSQGGAYIHNLIAGKIRRALVPERYTPYHLPHSTEVAGISIIPGGDCKYLNNIFLAAYADENTEKYLDFGLNIYDEVHYPMLVTGNAYFNHAEKNENEQHSMAFPGFNTEFRLEDNGDEVAVYYNIPAAGQLKNSKLVKSFDLGLSRLAKARYESSDGSEIVFEYDYLNNKRDAGIVPGAIQTTTGGRQKIIVWEKQ